MKRRQAFHREQCRRPPAARNQCGKVAYLSRADARQALKSYPGERMRPYRCPGCDLWHCGHVPPAVREGRKTADELYRPTTREDTNP